MQKKLILLFSTVFVLLVVFVIGSLYDDPLTPESAAAINYKPPIVPYEKNAFVAMVGFNAPKDKNYMQEGLHIIEQANAKSPNAKFIEAPNGLKAKGIDIHSFNDCMSLGNKSCLPDINTEEKVNKLLRENSTLVSRYLHMQALPIFSNELAPSYEFPNFSAIFKIKYLLTIKALIDIRQGYVERGFSFLERDILFYRRMYSGHVGLISLLLANANIFKDYHLLSLLIADPSFDAKHYALRLRALLTPLPKKEKTLRHALCFEMLLIDLTVNGIADHQISLIFKKNMTINALNKRIPSDKFLADVHEYNFEQKEQEFNKGYDRFNTSIFSVRRLREKGISFWKNIIGDILLNTNSLNFFSSLPRLYDVDVYASLVRAQLALRLAALPTRQVPDKLKQLDSSFNNPFTRRPFAWNSTKRTLSFKAHSANIARYSKFGLLEAKVPLP